MGQGRSFGGDGLAFDRHILRRGPSSEFFGPSNSRLWWIAEMGLNPPVTMCRDLWIETSGRHESFLAPVMGCSHTTRRSCDGMDSEGGSGYRGRRCWVVKSAALGRMFGTQRVVC